MVVTGEWKCERKGHARVKKEWKITLKVLTMSGKLMAVGCWFPPKFPNSGTLGHNPWSGRASCARGRGGERTRHWLVRLPISPSNAPVTQLVLALNTTTHRYSAPLGRKGRRRHARTHMKTITFSSLGRSLILKPDVFYGCEGIPYP